MHNYDKNWVRFGQQCFEMSTYSVTWGMSWDREALARGEASRTYKAMRFPEGANYPTDEWMMRAISVNDTHVCSFWNGASSCVYWPNFYCPNPSRST